ncbi:MAG: zf-HC2 domain-containing protein [Gemmatimonadetes bacterium]|nr:zf-HC2 domain-containing protein [Gemmatimonadota bacterium]
MHLRHVDDERIQRLLHGELASPAADLVRDHLAGCAECRARVAQAQREEGELHALLRHLDHPLPRVGAEAVAARARVPGSAWGWRAAGILLALAAAGVAYAAPGSPLPGWVDEVITRLKGAEPAAPPPRPRVAGQSVSGIALRPGQDLAIVFVSTHADGQATVTLTDEAEVLVRALTDPATFTSELDRLVVDGHGAAGRFEIRIPRAAPRVEIRVGDRRVLLKEGARVSTSAPADASGSYLLPLRPGL